MTFTSRLLQQMQYEYENHDNSGVYAMTQQLMGYHSNKIEGGTLTKQQVATLFGTGSLSWEGTGIKAKDVEEMAGHFKIFEHMLQTYSHPLSESLVKEYHFLLKADVFEDKANGYPVGEYKNRRNVVSNIITAEPSEVPKRMAGLLSSYEVKEDISLEDIAKLHADFERIHPFQDGNGRVGRMIVFKECLRHDIVPVLIFDDAKMDYYLALQHLATHEGEYGKLVSYFAGCQDRYHNIAKDFLAPEPTKTVAEIIEEANKKAEDRNRRIADQQKAIKDQDILK